MKIAVKKLSPFAVLPVYGSDCAAGADLFAALEAPLEIAPGETALIPTGIALEIPEGYFGAVFARSGLATKNGLRPANCVGVIDSDYRGEVMVALHNDTDLNQVIENGERIAQLVILPCAGAEYREVSELSETERGDGGFGSSGTKEVKKKKQYKEIELDDEFWSM